MKKAFTLIELLVVVLIIGILAAIALPQYQVAVGRARFAEVLMAAESLHRAEELFYLANGHYTEDLSELDFDVNNPHVDLSVSAEGAYLGGSYHNEEVYLILYLNHSSVGFGRECRAIAPVSKVAKQICASATGAQERDNGTYSEWTF